MKIIYFNDENKVVTVQIFGYSADPSIPYSTSYHPMLPNTVSSFEVPMLASHIPYIKKWDKVVMLSYMDPSAWNSIPDEGQKD